MTPEQFVYWLQGFSELNGNICPTPDQWKSIKEHLDTVFGKVTPPVGNETDRHLQEAIRRFESLGNPKRIC